MGRSWTGKRRRRTENPARTASARRRDQRHDADLAQAVDDLLDHAGRYPGPHGVVYLDDRRPDTADGDPDDVPDIYA